MVDRGRPSETMVMFGGTFDPVHNGHLVSALEARRKLGVDRIYLLPCLIPPHGKTPSASAGHRLNMLKAVCAQQPGLAVDERELHRDRPSYTVDSVRDIRAERGKDTCMIWMVGWDSLQGLDTWHRWREIFDYTNLAVLRRPGYAELEKPVLKEALAHRWVAPEELRDSSHGKIGVLVTPAMSQSSSEIRRKIGAGESVEQDVPAPVWNYIKEQQLYGVVEPLY